MHRVLKEFLFNNYLLITHFVEITVAVVGVFYYKKYKASVAKYFIWFLVYVAILELIGGYPGYVAKYEF